MMAANIVTPYTTSPNASAANNHVSEPVICRTSQPPPAAINRRRNPPVSGQNSRPAPCDEK
jgi:hypothetical protein